MAVGAFSFDKHPLFDFHMGGSLHLGGLRHESLFSAEQIVDSRR